MEYLVLKVSHRKYLDNRHLYRDFHPKSSQAATYNHVAGSPSCCYNHVAGAPSGYNQQQQNINTAVHMHFLLSHVTHVNTIY